MKELLKETEVSNYLLKLKVGNHRTFYISNNLISEPKGKYKIERLE